MLKYLLFCLTFVTVSAAFSQEFQWAEQIESDYYAGTYGIHADNSGNIYILGDFQDSTDFDLGPGEHILYPDTYSYNLFLAKYDTDGALIWVRSWTMYSIYRIPFTVDADGNCYLLGKLEVTTDMDPGPGEYILTPEGGQNAFLMKLDPEGNLVFAINWGSINTFDYGDLALDADGNIFTATFMNGTYDMDPGPDEWLLSSNGGNNAFLSKFDNDGNFQWAVTYGDSASVNVRGITINPVGKIALTGRFLADADFDPGPDVFMQTIGALGGGYVMLLDTDGSLLWAKSWGGEVYYGGGGYDIISDESSNLYIAGDWSYEIDMDPGPDEFWLTSLSEMEISITKLNAFGTFQWANAYGTFVEDYVTGMVVDDGGLVFAGFSGFVTRIFTDDGALDWEFTISGGSDDWCSGITMTLDGSFYYTGYFNATVDFNPGVGVNELTAPFPGNIFISKFKLCNTLYTTTDISACDSLVSPSGNQIWYLSGIYQDTLLSALGCDSILTVNLEVSAGTVSDLEVNACGS